MLSSLPGDRLILRHQSAACFHRSALVWSDLVLRSGQLTRTIRHRLPSILCAGLAVLLVSGAPCWATVCLLGDLAAVLTPSASQKVSQKAFSGKSQKRAPSKGALPTTPYDAAPKDVATVQAAAQLTPHQENAPASAQSKEQKSFSELTLFLFASGLAILIALLGWSDQIRGIDKDTKELEDHFLEDTGINKQDFLSIVKSQSPDEQLEALTQVAEKLETGDMVVLLQTFKEWNKQWSRLERLSLWKYDLMVALTLVLFIAGIASLFTTPSQSIQLYFMTIRSEMIVLLLPMIIIGSLLAIIICSAKLEKRLRALLSSIADMV
jgi:hypothetical protein